MTPDEFLGGAAGAPAPPAPQAMTPDAFMNADGPAPQGQDVTVPPGGVSGVLPNIAAGGAEGVAAAINTPMDLTGNVVGTPIDRLFPWAYNLGARVFGYQPMSDEDRRAWMGFTPNQGGSALVSKTAHAIGLPAPEEVTAASPLERVLRAGTATAVGVGAMGAGGLRTAALAGGSGAAGQTAAEVAPEGWQEPINLATQLSTMFLFPYAGAKIAQGTAGARQAIQTATGLMGQSAVDRAAAQRVATAMGQTPGEAATTMANLPAPPLEGSQPTLGQLTGHSGTLSFEEQLRRSPTGREAFNVADAQRQAAQTAALAGAAPADVGDVAGAWVRAHLDALEDANAAQAQRLGQGASETLAQTGATGHLQGEQDIGAGIREGIEADRAPIKARLGAAFDAMDPEGTLAQDSTPFADAAQSIRQGAGKRPDFFPGEEDRLADAEESRGVTLFSSLRQQQSNISAILRRIRNNPEYGPESQPYRRMSQLLGASHDAIAAAAERAAARDTAPVGERIIDQMAEGAPPPRAAPITTEAASAELAEPRLAQDPLRAQALRMVSEGHFDPAQAAKSIAWARANGRDDVAEAIYQHHRAVEASQGGGPFSVGMDEVERAYSGGKSAGTPAGGAGLGGSAAARAGAEPGAGAGEAGAGGAKPPPGGASAPGQSAGAGGDRGVAAPGAAPRVGAPTDAVSYIIRNGGVKPHPDIDESAADIHHRGAGRLINPNGMDLNDVREQMGPAGEGFFHDDDERAAAQFINKVTAEAKAGRKVYRPEDQAAGDFHEAGRAEGSTREHFYQQYRDQILDAEDERGLRLSDAEIEHAVNLMNDSGGRMDPHEAVRQAGEAGEQIALDRNAARNAMGQPGMPLAEQQAMQLPEGGHAPLEENFTGNTAADLKRNAREYADYKNTYRSGAVGEVLASGKGPGGYRVADSAVPGRLFKAGPSGAEAADSLIKQAGSVEKAEARLGDYPALVFRNEAMRDGVVIPDRFDRFQAKYGAALAKFPNLAAKFRTAAEAQRTVDAAAAAGQARIAAFQRSAAARYLTKSGDIVDANRAIGQLLNSPNPGASFRELMGQMRGDQAAIDGVARNLVDVIQRRASTTRELPSGDRALGKNAFQRVMADPKMAAAIDAVLSPRQKRILQNISADMDLMDRGVQAVKIPGSPGTAADLRAMVEGGGLGGLTAYGLLWAGEKAGEITGWLMGLGPFGRAIAEGIGTLGANTIRSRRAAGIGRIEQAATEMVLQPATVGRVLMERLAAGESPQLLARRVSNGLQRAVATVATSSQQQQGSQ